MPSNRERGPNTPTDVPLTVTGDSARLLTGTAGTSTNTIGISSNRSGYVGDELVQLSTEALQRIYDNSLVGGSGGTLYSRYNSWGAMPEPAANDYFDFGADWAIERKKKTEPPKPEVVFQWGDNRDLNRNKRRNSPPV